MDSRQSAYRTSSLLNVKLSSNNKADTVVSELKQFAIALRILKKYPDAFNEFKKEIRHPEEGGPSSYRMTEGNTHDESFYRENI